MKAIFALTRKPTMWLLAALILVMMASLSLQQAHDERGGFLDEFGGAFLADEFAGVAHASSAPDAPAYAFLIVGNANLRVSWAPVSDATKYEVHYSDDNGANWTTHSNNVTSTSVTVNGVNPTKVYVGRVRAGNASDQWSNWKVTNSHGPYTTDKVVTTPIDEESRKKLDSINEGRRRYHGDHYGQPSPTPAPAPYIHFTNIASTTATLNVKHNNAAWSYKQGTGNCSSAQSASTTSVNLTGLTASTTYNYQAWTNGTCSGASFARDNFTTLAPPPVTLAASAIGRTTATLTIAGHTAQWWYKADVGPDSTCQGPVTAGTSAESLTGLTEETAYVYKAYSATGCGAADLLATAASFTTLSPPYVSTLGYTSSGDSIILDGVQKAVGFTTGSNPTGYTLTSVTMPLKKYITGTGTLAITLHDASGDVPATTSLATLTGTSPTSSTFNDTTWTCSGSGCELSPNTKYFIAATQASNSGQFSWRYSSVNPTQSRHPSDNGWTIGNSAQKIGSNWASWSFYHIFRADFEFNPTLTASNVTSSSATLTLNNQTGTWYSRRIHPDTTVCSIGVTGATQNRDSLTSNTTYAYTAFSDSACRTELDTAYFSTTDAAVGNLKEKQESTNWTVGGSTDVKYATAFTTGGQSFGYNLTSVTLDFAAKTGTAGDISVALHAADTGNASNPAATASATLTGSDPDAAGLQTYACSGSGCDLDPNATYFIVTSAATGTGSYNQRNTASDAESVQSPATGWTIANAGRSKTGAGAWAAATTSASMRVAANVKPPTLTASSITSTGATLTIANHTGNWYHKETHPSTTASCSTVNANTTATLSSLTADKFYAYTAYSDSGCTAANALATAYFSTTDDGVGNLNEESDFDITVGRGGSNNQSVTAPFATGSVASNLESVTLRFDDKSATGTPGNIQVTIHEPNTSNSSNPSSTAKATLTGSNPNTAGLYTWTCSSGCYLNADSTYFVKASAPSASGAGAYSLSLTQSDDEINHPAANGWSIGDQGRHMSQRFPWAGHALGRVASMHVAANDAPTLTASNVTANDATLTIGGHTAQWWYKTDKAPHATCQGPVAAGTSAQSFDGLTAGETYVYSAYDATGCADADLIAVAAAFTTTVSVSNLSQTNENTYFTMGTHAQGFTTGSSNSTMLSATVEFFSIFSNSNVSVSLRAAKSDGKPAATNRATLTGTPAAGQTKFTCDASNSSNDCSLDKNTKYFIVASGNSGYLRTTDGNSETLVPTGNGWSIEDAARQGPNFNLDAGGKAMKIKVEAKPQATLSAGTITGAAATLTMKYHVGDWWFKANKGFFSGDCESVSGTTRTLGSYLAKQTTYVFTAYSDSGCTTANALDSVTFTTTGTALSVSGVTGTGATLTIAGRTTAWWYDADTGPDTTCQSVAANTSSDTLTGLTAGSTYTYTAYSASGCASTNELDSVTFSTSDVTVGNLGELSDSTDCAVGFNISSRKCATSFTTGSHSAGYTLKSVTGLFDDKTGTPGSIVVAIHAADATNSSHPASSASITLTGSNPNAEGLYTFTCSSGCDLTANTTYFVVMSTADTSQRKLYAWQRTTSGYETVRPSTATGWSIADAGLENAGSGWTALPRNHTGLLHVAADNKTSG